MTEPKIIDPQVARVDGPNDKELIIKTFQDVPDWYIDRLKEQSDAQKQTFAKDLRRVASIPLAVVEKWKREGFDIEHETAQAIVARLQREDLGAFITGLP